MNILVPLKSVLSWKNVKKLNREGFYNRFYRLVLQAIQHTAETGKEVSFCYIQYYNKDIAAHFRLPITPMIEGTDFSSRVNIEEAEKNAEGWFYEKMGFFHTHPDNCEFSHTDILVLEEDFQEAILASPKSNVALIAHAVDPREISHLLDIVEEIERAAYKICDNREITDEQKKEQLIAARKRLYPQFDAQIAICHEKKIITKHSIQEFKLI